MNRKNLLKPVPTIEHLFINYNGSIIEYKGKLLKTSLHVAVKNSFPVVRIKYKMYLVSKLVFWAWIGKLPDYRKVTFKDNNHFNTDFRNLLPKKPDHLVKLVSVPNLDNVKVNESGTVVTQHGFILDIYNSYDDKIDLRVNIRIDNKTKVLSVRKLVAMTFLKAKIDNKIYHKDKNPNNLHYDNLLPIITNPNQSNHIITIDEKIEIKKRLLEGELVRELALSFNVSIDTMLKYKRSILNDEELKIVKSKRAFRIISNKDKPKLIQQLINGDNLTKIAFNYGVHRSLIDRFRSVYLTEQQQQLRIQNIKINKRKNRYSTAVKQKDKKVIIALILSGVSLNKIARDFKVLVSALYQFERKNFSSEELKKITEKRRL